MKQKTIKAVFFLILLMPFVVSYFALQVRKGQIKKEVKHLLMTTTPKEDLYSLKFSISESKTLLKWEKKHEFEFEGKMYDIVEETYKNDSVFYICWLDKEETELNKKLYQLTHFNFLKDVEKRNCEGALVYLIENQFFPPNSMQLTFNLTPTTKHSFTYSKDIQTRYLTPNSPPPEFMLS